MRGGRLRPVALAIALLCSAFAPSLLADTQQIALSTGWNLISIQVGTEATGFTIAQVRGGLDRTNVLDSIWAYNPVLRTYASYQSITNYPNDLAALKPGVGYWVKVTSDVVLTLAGPVWNGAVNLSPGWNLVGFPGLARSATEVLTLEAIFRDRSAKVPQVWAFQAGSSLVGGQRFVGYDTTARPPLGELKTIEPGRGYWVFGGEALSLAPAPALVLAPDTDVADAAGKLGAAELFVADTRWRGTNAALYAGRMVTYAGPEDAATDLNANGILDDPYTQNIMLFEESVNTQDITILNTNSSLLNWSITTATPWLAFSATAGTTASESDYVAVSVNRTGLTNGTYTGSFTVDFGSTQRVVTVLMRVPTIAGDYRGAATTTRVNGNSVSLGKVDLNLTMFMEGDLPTTNRFRGVINRDFALLFPQDVFLDGVFYQGNNFSLTTTFEMAAGDRFEPPYETATNLYNYNPFPNAIYRQVTLQGARTTADRVEGAYVESISGVLPNSQRITIEGTFALDRQSVMPTKKSIYNGRSPTTPVSIGGSGGGVSSYTNTLNVPSAVSIQGVDLTVNTTYPNPGQLTFTLFGPTNVQGLSQTYVLVNRSSTLANSAKFSLTNFNGTIGQGDWRLVVNWNGSSERGLFNGWELNLQGLATYTASGTIVSTNTGSTLPAAGATLTLVGGNIIFQAVTPTDGTFTFPSLTENAYTLGVTKLGYQDTSAFFRVTRSSTNLGNLVLQPLTNATATVLATPTVGAAPLNVTFSPLVPLAQLATLGANITSSWTFGDGSTLVLPNPGATVEHVYTNGIYTNATLVLRGSSGSPITLTSPSIHAHALGPNTNIAPHQVGVTFASPRTNFLSAIAFIGSVAAPVQNIGTDVQSVTTSNATTGYFYQEMKRDVAAFDIDRFRSGTPAFDPNAEDSGFFVQANTPYAGISTKDPVLDRLAVPATGQSYLAYPQPGQTGKQTRFRLITTMGGFVFGTQPASSGNFTLQTGRIEP
jgi:subtilisin-like proprotein convertase family protein